MGTHAPAAGPTSDCKVGRVDVPATCVGCDEQSIALTAVVIACDGSQVAATCPDCGRLVRPFSWHGDDGQPSAYLLRFDHQARAVEASAWYGAAGSVRPVPAVDPDCPARHWWPSTFRTTTLARAILAHLVGLDVATAVWEAFEFDVILPLALGVGKDVTLPVDEILDWLDRNRDLSDPYGPETAASEVER